MKKICVFLCITVVMMSFSAVAFAGNEQAAVSCASLSSPHPVIVPADKDSVSGVAVMHEFLIPCGFSGAVAFQGVAAVDKYTPEIMEQINIISVAPRE